MRKEDLGRQLVEDIIRETRHLDKTFASKIYALISLYEEEQEKNLDLKEENKKILAAWDKRNQIPEETKDQIIEQQSRLASMGEMIDAIAHQWKQPLNAISMMIEMLKDDFHTSDITSEYINDLEKSIHIQIDYMVSTLSEFRNFLRPSTKNTQFYINTIIQNVQILMKDELIAQNLHLELDIDENIQFFGSKNEFKHLFINIINNSIDAFNEKNISERKLSIKAYKDGKDIYLQIKDNAGGIPTNIINHIFKPNITTKADGKGTGIGLYMCQQIVAKNNGKIEASNTEDGALFSISFRESSI